MLGIKVTPPTVYFLEIAMYKFSTLNQVCFKPNDWTTSDPLRMRSQVKLSSTTPGPFTLISEGKEVAAILVASCLQASWHWCSGGMCRVLPSRSGRCARSGRGGKASLSRRLKDDPAPWSEQLWWGQMWPVTSPPSSSESFLFQRRRPQTGMEIGWAVNVTMLWRWPHDPICFVFQSGEVLVKKTNVFVLS